MSWLCTFCMSTKTNRLLDHTLFRFITFVFSWSQKHEPIQQLLIFLWDLLKIYRAKLFYAFYANWTSACGSGCESRSTTIVSVFLSGVAQRLIGKTWLCSTDVTFWLFVWPVFCFVLFWGRGWGGCFVRSVWLPPFLFCRERMSRLN